MSDKRGRQRRDFLKTAGTGAAVVAANFFVHAADKAGTNPAGKATPAMNSDIVNPMPPSAPAPHN